MAHAPEALHGTQACVISSATITGLLESHGGLVGASIWGTGYRDRVPSVAALEKQDECNLQPAWLKDVLSRLGWSFEWTRPASRAPRSCVPGHGCRQRLTHSHMTHPRAHDAS